MTHYRVDPCPVLTCPNGSGWAWGGEGLNLGDHCGQSFIAPGEAEGEVSNQMPFGE